jgi:hypothetical protein
VVLAWDHPVLPLPQVFDAGVLHWFQRNYGLSALEGQGRCGSACPVTCAVMVIDCKCRRESHPKSLVSVTCQVMAW